MDLFQLGWDESVVVWAVGGAGAKRTIDLQWRASISIGMGLGCLNISLTSNSNLVKVHPSSVG